MMYANNDIGKKNKSFLLLKTIQDIQANDLQQIEIHKLWLRAVTFMDMLLLTLPESIYNYYNQDGHDIPLHGFNITARNKGSYDPQNLPTIQTFIPPELLPSTILKDEQKVTSYSTPILERIMQMNEAAKNKPKRKSGAGFANPTLTANENGADDYVPPKDIHSPKPEENLHHVQIGKLCQDYAQIIEKVKSTMEPLESMKEGLKKARTKKDIQTSLTEVIGTLENIANTTLDDECTKALNAFNGSEDSPTTRNANKRKRQDDKEHKEGQDDDKEKM
jgi:hypothetical protein